jgi:hypothetical protein
MATGADHNESKLLFMLESVQNLRREMTEQHQRLRSDMSASATGVTQEVVAMRETVRQIALDVNTLKAQRDIEEKYSTKRAMLTGALAGAVFTALMKIGEVLWHR